MTQEEIERFLSKYPESALFKITLHTEIDHPLKGSFTKAQIKKNENIWMINEFISNKVTQQTELIGDFIAKIKVSG